MSVQTSHVMWHASLRYRYSQTTSLYCSLSRHFTMLSMKYTISSIICDQYGIFACSIWTALQAAHVLRNCHDCWLHCRSL